MRVLKLLTHLVIFFTMSARLWATPKPIEVETQNTPQAGEDYIWASDRFAQSEHLYPSLWGQVGIFRVRSGESLPEGAITFGIGGEFYSFTGVGPNFGLGPTSASTIAESLFVGYAPIEHLTLSLARRNSSTTFSSPGQAAQLISSLGDFTFGASYSFAVTPSLSLAPLVNLMVASDFNSLAPSGYTFSGGVGANATFNFYSLTQLPLFAHANLIYNSPQISSLGPASLQPETFFLFTRYNSITIGLGAEYHIGDFIPFLEYTDLYPAASGLAFFNAPSRITIGSRFTPSSNKSLAFLAGMDIGLGRGLVPGVPFNPPAQVIAQVSYTTGLVSNERKHYYTTHDVHVVNRKFIIKKNINFKIASAVIENSSMTILDQIADVILKNKSGKILIVGHTDSSHTEDYNNKLSLDRANAVKTYLVSKGVDEDTLMTQGYGKRKPRASNATEEGRAKNRRVEFFIVE